MSIRQKNQHFGTLDLIMLVVLCGTVSSVVGASVAGLLHDDRPSRARASAESLAYQIHQQHDSALPAPSAGGRAPASVEDVPPLTDGQIGKDPWGQPFNYTVLGNPTAPNSTVVVWSSGPNGKLESKIDEIGRSGSGTTHFRGDDIGFIMSPKSTR